MVSIEIISYYNMIIITLPYANLTAPGGAPQDVIAQSFILRMITLSWNSPLMDRHYGTITGYYITYQEAENGPSSSITTDSGNILGVNLTVSSSDTLYTITIAAINGIGMSPFNATVSARTIAEREFITVPYVRMCEIIIQT